MIPNLMDFQVVIDLEGEQRLHEEASLFAWGLNKDLFNEDFWCVEGACLATADRIGAMLFLMEREILSAKLVARRQGLDRDAELDGLFNSTLQFVMAQTLWEGKETTQTNNIRTAYRELLAVYAKGSSPTLQGYLKDWGHPDTKEDVYHMAWMAQSSMELIRTEHHVFMKQPEGR